MSCSPPKVRRRARRARDGRRGVSRPQVPRHSQHRPVGGGERRPVGVRLVTVHASGGGRCSGLRPLPRPRRRESVRGGRVLAVSVLTRRRPVRYDEAWDARPRCRSAEVVRLARASPSPSGIDGLVCSAMEATAVLHALGVRTRDAHPGIRLSGNEVHAQVGSPLPPRRPRGGHLYRDRSRDHRGARPPDRDGSCTGPARCSVCRARVPDQELSRLRGRRTLSTRCSGATLRAGLKPVTVKVLAEKNRIDRSSRESPQQREADL